MAQLVEALRYKLRGRELDSRWCHWNYSLTSFRPHYDPGFDSASNRNDFLGGKGDRCVGLTTLPPSCADCHEIWEPQPPRDLTDCPGLYMDCVAFTSLLSITYELLKLRHVKSCSKNLYHTYIQDKILFVAVHL